MFPAVEKLTAERVRSEVQRYWNLFSSKSADQLTELYLPEATVFGSDSTRSEPGRLAAARRRREYFQPLTTVTTKLGTIEVHLLGPEYAVASYTFEFHASKVASATGRTDENIRNGRATQVFQLDPEAGLRIVHEHFSAVDRD